MMLRVIRRFFHDEQGPTAVEYAVMLALILVAVIASVSTVGNSTSQLWSSDTTRITNAMNGS